MTEASAYPDQTPSVETFALEKDSGPDSQEQAIRSSDPPCADGFKACNDGDAMEAEKSSEDQVVAEALVLPQCQGVIFYKFSEFCVKTVLYCRFMR